MIIKALIAKKIAVVATLSAMALADAGMTNQNHARGAREMNPFVRPFVGSPAIYAATQFDVVLTGILLLTRPESRITKAIMAETFASHGWGIGTNLSYRPDKPAALTVVCTRFGPHGANETCVYQNWQPRRH